MESKIIYISIFIFSIFFASLFDKTQNKLFLIISFLILTVPSVLRFDVAPDYQNYVITFKSIYLGYTEKGGIDDYFVFNIFSSFFLSNPKGYIYVFAIYAILINILFYRVFIKFGFVFYSLFAFFVFGLYFDSLDRLRQFLSIAIFLNIYNDFLLKRKIKSFIIIIILTGIFIHKSSFFLLIVPFLLKIRIKKTFAVLIIVGLTLFSFMGLMKNVWTSFFTIISLVYNRYGVDSVYALNGGFNSGLGFIFKIILILFMLIYVPERNRKIFNFIFIGGILYIIASGNLIISRFAAYFLSYSVIALPLALKKVSETPIRPIIILGSLIFFIKDIGRTHFSYKSIFSNQYKIEEFEERNYDL